MLVWFDLILLLLLLFSYEDAIFQNTILMDASSRDVYYL